MIFIRDTLTGGALTEATFFILIAVYTPNHGYGIMQFVERETDGRLILGPGTLYGAINLLLKKGWIELISNKDRKKEYCITEEGKKIVEIEINRLNNVLTIAHRITGRVK